MGRPVIFVSVSGSTAVITFKIRITNSKKKKKKGVAAAAPAAARPSATPPGPPRRRKAAGHQALRQPALGS
ncbi:hypothetical protein [Oryza sativa Japonica Group]|uniref:Uncharacterized protein P0581F09.16 n=1 Tax=Oryza sativa subsp. japonica TaxID=39947 RepID=Q5N7E9_ORYSJ|nr:hypothetical protein [Oryza sativa Japonica Group]